MGSLDEPRAAGSDNPNVVYENLGCTGKFKLNFDVLQQSGRLRNYNGFAMGDFNLDGYPDVVAASGYVASKTNLTRVIRYGSPLDKTAFFTDILNLNKDKTFSWTGNSVFQGDMMVQMNRPMGSKNCWVSIKPLGTRGLVTGGSVNRGGLGSTLIVTPNGMATVMTPIVSGESFGSQHSPRRNFGLGKSCEGTLEILWPGGIRNRLYSMWNKEVLTVPEIPCSFTGHWESESDYMECVNKAVDELLEKDIIADTFQERLVKSAQKARMEYIANI